MNDLPYCRLLATGLDMHGLKQFSDARPASKGFRFPSGRSHEVDVERRDAPLLFALAARP